MKSEGVVVEPKAVGTKREMQQWQHEKILEYKISHDGQRPRLNKNDY